MSDKGICDKCGQRAKLYYCERCGKMICKNCLKKSMMGTRKCPFCEGLVE
jgi:hypothetical protein